MKFYRNKKSRVAISKKIPKRRKNIRGRNTTYFIFKKWKQFLMSLALQQILYFTFISILTILWKYFVTSRNDEEYIVKFYKPLGKIKCFIDSITLNNISYQFKCRKVDDLNSLLSRLFCSIKAFEYISVMLM